MNEKLHKQLKYIVATLADDIEDLNTCENQEDFKETIHFLSQDTKDLLRIVDKLTTEENHNENN